MFSEEHLYAIALRRCSHIGDIHFRKLTRAFGSAETIWKESKSILAKIEGLKQNRLSEIGKKEHLDFAENELKFCMQNNIKILLRHQNELPYFLDECSDAPAILYQKGNLQPTRKPISVVGTRNMTVYGKTFLEDFHKKAQKKDIVTVSGLAHGVDTQVHLSSLNNGLPTIAVLAHGFQTLYPAANRKLAQDILNNGGALLTEFNSSQKPDRENFLQRNRIITGLSRHLIVVETAFGGGSISTATFANGYNRDVYALPGKITDKYSQGCNQLIAQNKAATISNLNDLFESLELSSAKKTLELFPEEHIIPALSPAETELYNTIRNTPLISLDELALEVSKPVFEILPLLLELEIKNHIKTHSGRQFTTV